MYLSLFSDELTCLQEEDYGAVVESGRKTYFAKPHPDSVADSDDWFKHGCNHTVYFVNYRDMSNTSQRMQVLCLAIHPNDDMLT